MADIITVAGLSQEAKKYQPQLKLLPYYMLMERLAYLGVGLLEVAGIDTLIETQRKGGLLRAYDEANIDNETDILRFVERDLATKRAVISMKDNITNYNTKKLLNVPEAGTGINQDKKHPFADLITATVIKTCAEDILTALFPASYDKLDRSPLGAFTGFDTLIDNYIAGFEITEALGNLKPTGAIVAPVDENDTSAIDKIVGFVRSSDDFLQDQPAIMLMTKATYRNAQDALENKFKYKDADFNAVQAYINDKAGSNVFLRPNNTMGVGDRLILQKPGNFHFGMDTFSDHEFVQTRNPWEDPNLVQFWLQAAFGTRIASLHRKSFCVNDGTPIAKSFGGDYTA